MVQRKAGPGRGLCAVCLQREEAAKILEGKKERRKGQARGQREGRGEEMGKGGEGEEGRGRE